MGLPTELRLMIFRCLFPKDVGKDHRVKVAILKTNRQLNQEASSGLYGESIFEATIEPGGVTFRGQKWKRDATVPNKSTDHSMSGSLSGTSIAMIRNFSITLTVEDTYTCPKGLRGELGGEEYTLYALRDSIRKFADCISSPNLLRSLQAKAILWSGRNWTPLSMTAALFFVLEPLQQLHVVTPSLRLAMPPWESRILGKQLLTNVRGTKTYKSLRKNWLKALADPDHTIRKASPIVETGYRKIEAFAHLIQTQASASPKCWTSTVFQNLECPLRWARVAYETDDAEMMAKINETINVRWVNAYREQQVSLQAVADSINTMFQQEQKGTHNSKGGKGKAYGTPTPREIYPDAYEFEIHQALEQDYPTVRSHLWEDLRAADTAPKRGEPAVTVVMGHLRYDVCKDGKKWSRFITPALIQELDREDREKAQAV
jgi:hypothetical protein